MIGSGGKGERPDEVAAPFALAELDRVRLDDPGPVSEVAGAGPGVDRLAERARVGPDHGDDELVELREEVDPLETKQ